MSRPSALPVLALAMTIAFAGAGCGSAGILDGPGVNGTPAFVQGVQRATGSLDVSGSALSTAGSTVSWPDDGRSVTLDPGAASGVYFQKGAIVGARAVFDASWTSGTATEVLVRCVARGPIASRSPSALVVAGIDVRVDALTTVMDASGGPTTLASLADGARVEVHGWAETGTRLRASLVRVLPGTPAVTVRGWSRSAPVNGAFELSLLGGGAAVLRVEALGVPLGGIPANALVRVSGDLLTSGAIPTLTATSVAVEAQFLPRDGDSVNLEGIVTSRTGATLALGDFRVQTGGNAWIGLPAGTSPDTAIQPGVHLVVQGSVARGAVDASAITVLNLWTATGRIVPGSMAVGNPATYAVFTLSGSAVVVDETTTLTGADGTPTSIAELASLQSGSPTGLPVAVQGHRRADGDVQAERLVITGT